MPPPYRAAIYALFFLSGAVALVYQVGWVRSLTLVFGGSHLAVTVVLGVFMAGLALGGYAIGRAVDRSGRPLLCYGLLELGIAASALAVVGLLLIYPSVYVPLARGREDAPVYLTVVRTVFSVVALIVPTTLMGGTLPALTRVVAVPPASPRQGLALLYGFNTLGAVVGAVATGFLLLPRFPVSATLYLAVLASAAIGLASLVLQAWRPSVGSGPETTGEAPELAGEVQPAAAGPAAREAGLEMPSPEGAAVLPYRLVLWGIGLGGLCALGYEVLWTRVLTIAVGASVYAFTVMLAAFLAGIGLGSHAYGALAPLLGGKGGAGRRAIAWFGVVQLAAGVSAFLVTVALRDVPANAVRLQAALARLGVGGFGGRTWGAFVLAFAYMIVPALFLGIAFPLAGDIHARYRGRLGRAVGEVLAYNTVGAILGTAVSGFVLIHLLGIERSLQLLTVLQAGAGLVVLASLTGSRAAVGAAAVAGTAGLAVVATGPPALRLWDTSYFAIFRSNQPEAFATPELLREAVENTDVLYYAEGVESIVSVIRVKGGEQSFLTNGRVEASSHPQAQQVQLVLGHLPVLLARTPRNVLVVGMGSGMTLGATAVHPTVERVTVVEIEPRVLGVARTFAGYNHEVLESPKVRVVLNDGRNFLMTTPETFDVITADPIHPWFRGAGYLYTREYFRLVAAHLRPGGVVAQWLPIYELMPQDLQSVVRTFRESFRYTFLWLTHYDAELIGSNSPLLLDEAELARRMATPAVAEDLRRVGMGTAEDVLSYFVMGPDGLARFGRGGVLNTDDRLYLEFSAPFSVATPSVMEANVLALSAYRESLDPYLAPRGDPSALEAQRGRWERQLEAGRVGDVALALYLSGKLQHPHFAAAMAELDARYPSYAPGRFLKAEHEAALALEPRLLDAAAMTVAGDTGAPTVVQISAVLVPVSARRAAVMFVDNQARVIYGQRYVDDYRGSEAVTRLAGDVLADVRRVYQAEAELSMARRHAAPAAAETLPKIRAAIGTRLASLP